MPPLAIVAPDHALMPDPSSTVPVRITVKDRESPKTCYPDMTVERPKCRVDQRRGNNNNIVLLIPLWIVAIFGENIEKLSGRKVHKTRKISVINECYSVYRETGVSLLPPCWSQPYINYFIVEFPGLADINRVRKFAEWLDGMALTFLHMVPDEDPYDVEFRKCNAWLERFGNVS